MSLFGKKVEVELTRVRLEEPHGESGQAYGIADAIRLMRTLPVEQNTELVVRVIRSTLESLGVHVSEIIEDAARKQQLIQERITALESEIDEHSREIDVRRQEIGRLQADLSETTTAKERLQLAERAPLPSRPPLPHPPAPPPPPSRTTPSGAVKAAEPEPDPDSAKS